MTAVLARRSWQGFFVGLASVALVYLVELLVPSGWPRAAVVSVGWFGIGLGATLAAARAARAARPPERAPWLLITLGSAAWTIGMLTRSVYLIAESPIPSPSLADIATLAAAGSFGGGFVAFLRGQRLAIYALLLDAGAVLLLLLAAIVLMLTRVLASGMTQDPFFTTFAITQGILWAAATGAALSALWGIPVEVPRRSFATLVFGVGLNAVAFTVALPLYVLDQYRPGTFVDLLWMLGMCGIGSAASMWVEDRAGVGAPRISRDVIQLSRLALPGVLALTSAALIVIANATDASHAVRFFVDATVAAIMLILSIRAGLALYANWRLGELERRRARQFEALYDVGLSASGERSLDELAKLVVEQATGLSQCDGAMLSLAERGRGFIIRALYKGPMVGLRDSVGEELAGISLAAVESRDLVVAPRYAEHPRSTPALHDTIASAIAVPLIASGELVGTLAMYSATPRRFSGDTQRLVRLYAAQTAIAIANARLLAETHRLARHDDLTGVLNRRSLMDRLEGEVAQATRHGDIFAVVLCDLDGLKHVNDSAGHLAGNEVLVKVARVMRDSVRAEDVVARFGGDEFVLLLPRTGLLPAQALVGRIAARLRDEGYHWAGRDQPLPRVSFGIAWFPEDGRTEDALLAAADTRMYEDKSRSRDSREGAAEAD